MYCAGLAGSVGGLALTVGFGLFAQPLRLLEPVLQVADAGEVLVEPAAVAGADVPLQVLRLLGDDVEDAPPGVELADLRLDLGGRALQEELVEHPRTPGPPAGWPRRSASTTGCGRR